GKIVIPAELRRELGFNEGDRLVFERVGDTLVIKTNAQVVREVQDAFRPFRPADGSSIVDELIEERRLESRREDEESSRLSERFKRK
uniref:AbrB/MazE/SpoVT family DNA-binding domain-containing protein n=1 Tax=Blastomonas sp. TaxID=1909299 RepID=UPI00359396D9